MGFLTNRFIKSLLGLMLLCVFAVRPCAAFVRNVNALKNPGTLEKGIEESSKEKEKEEDKQNKGRYLPGTLPHTCGDCTAPDIAVSASRQLILSEIHGCSGPILQIQTPPPDLASRF